MGLTKEIPETVIVERVKDLGAVETHRASAVRLPRASDIVVKTIISVVVFFEFVNGVNLLSEDFRPAVEGAVVDVDAIGGEGEVAADDRFNGNKSDNHFPEKFLVAEIGHEHRFETHQGDLIVDDKLEVDPVVEIGDAIRTDVISKVIGRREGVVFDDFHDQNPGHDRHA